MREAPVTVIWARPKPGAVGEPKHTSLHCSKAECGAARKSAGVLGSLMRLNQITAPCADLESSIAFYALFGLKLIVKAPHYARFELPEGEATFSLHVVDGDIPTHNAPQIYFECDDLDAEVRRLSAAGLAFEQPPTRQSWLWYEAWLRDPAGNAVCLFHAGENRRHPPWRLGD